MYVFDWRKNWVLILGILERQHLISLCFVGNFLQKSTVKHVMQEVESRVKKQKGNKLLVQLVILIYYVWTLYPWIWLRNCLWLYLCFLYLFFSCLFSSAVWLIITARWKFLPLDLVQSLSFLQWDVTYLLFWPLSECNSAWNPPWIWRFHM